MSLRARHTIGCIILIVLGVSGIAAGIAAGSSVGWDLLSGRIQAGFGRHSPPLFIVPTLIGGGAIAAIAGIAALRLPVDSGANRDEL